MSREAAVSDGASLLPSATHSRPRAPRTRYFFEKPPFTSSRKRRRRVAGRIAAPPGPAARSSLAGSRSRQSTGVPFGSPFFFDLLCAAAAGASSSTSATSATTVRVIPFANISSHAHGGRRLKSAAYDPAPFLLRVDTGECEEILPKGGRQ